MTPPPYLRFGPYTVNACTGELWLNGRPVPIHRQAGLLLGLLAVRAPEMVGYDEIRRHLWGDRIVEFDQGIHGSVRKIRAALNDSPSDVRWIETVPRAGYRLVCDVRRTDRIPRRTGNSGVARHAALSTVMALATLITSSGSGVRPSVITIRGEGAGEIAIQVREAVARLSPAPIIQVSSHDGGGRHVLLTTNDRQDMVFPTQPNGIVDASVVATWVLSTLTRQMIPVDSAPALAREDYLRAGYLIKSGKPSQITAGRLILEDVVSRLSDFAPAHASLAMANLLLGNDTAARQAVNRALAIDPQNGLANLTLASLELWIHWDVERSKELHHVLLEQYPGWADARVSYAFLLSTQGQHDRAIANAELALALDPVSPTIHGDLGLVYLMAREYDRAADECQSTLDLAPEAWIARDCRISAFIAMGDTSAARSEIYEIMTALGANSQVASNIQQSGARDALTRYWQWTLGWAAPRDDRWYPYFAARAYLNLGDTENAITVLQRAVRDHRSRMTRHWTEEPQMAGTAMLVALNVDPRMDALRGHPRFQHLTRQIASLNECCQ